METNFSKPSGKSNSSSNNTGESEKENAMGTIEVNENVVGKKDKSLLQVSQVNKFVKIQKTKEHAFGFVLRGSKSKYLGAGIVVTHGKHSRELCAQKCASFTVNIKTAGLCAQCKISRLIF